MRVLIAREEMRLPERKKSPALDFSEANLDKHARLGGSMMKEKDLNASIEAIAHSVP